MSMHFIFVCVPDAIFDCLSKLVLAGEASTRGERGWMGQKN
jgi:hypothetical protein